MIFHTYDILERERWSTANNKNRLRFSNEFVDWLDFHESKVKVYHIDFDGWIFNELHTDCDDTYIWMKLKWNDHDTRLYRGFYDIECDKVWEKLLEEKRKYFSIDDVRKWFKIYTY